MSDSVSTDVVLVRLLSSRTKQLWEDVLNRLPTLNTNELFKEHQELRERLQEIESLQRSFHSENQQSCPERSRQEWLDAFKQWVERMDISHGDVDVIYVDSLNGFGLQAVHTIRMGSDILQVPRKAILSWDLARESLFLKRAFERDVIVRSMDIVALALLLCCQKLLPDSSWQPYINILPSDFNTPLFYSIEELQDIRPSPMFEETLLLYRNVARQFVHFLLAVLHADDHRRSSKAVQLRADEEPIFFNTPFTVANFTFDLYRWSVACITTRVNMIPSLIAKDTCGQPSMIPSLIPLFDMANHKYTAEAYHEAVHFSDENDYAEIVALHDYEPGEAITIFYGWRSNREYLLHNGFVPVEPNIRDIYKLRIGLPKNKREGARLKAIKSLGFQIETSIFAFDVRLYEPHFHNSLIQFARIYVLDQFPTEEDIQDILNSSENVQKAWSFLSDRFAILQRAYGNVVDPLASGHRAKSSSGESGSGSLEVDAKWKIERLSMIARLKLSELSILSKAEDYCRGQLAELKAIEKK